MLVSLASSVVRQPIKTGTSTKEAEFLAKQILERLVNVDVSAFFVFHEGDGRTVVHETVEERLTLAQSVLRQLTFG